MIIFNTTYCVSQKAYANFLKWLKENHLPQTLASGFFTDAKVSRVLMEDSEDETEQHSISVQLTATDLDAVAAWHEKHGDLFRMEVSSLFSEEVLYFSTFMETIEI